MNTIRIVLLLLVGVVTSSASPVLDSLTISDIIEKGRTCRIPIGDQMITLSSGQQVPDGKGVICETSLGAGNVPFWSAPKVLTVVGIGSVVAAMWWVLSGNDSLPPVVITSQSSTGIVSILATAAVPEPGTLALLLLGLALMAWAIYTPQLKPL